MFKKSFLSKSSCKFTTLSLYRAFSSTEKIKSLQLSLKNNHFADIICVCGRLLNRGEVRKNDDTDLGHMFHHSLCDSLIRHQYSLLSEQTDFLRHLFYNQTFHLDSNYVLKDTFIPSLLNQTLAFGLFYTNTAFFLSFYSEIHFPWQTEEQWIYLSHHFIM